MLQSSPNVWYNIDELYTISNQGTIELNTMDYKDRMSATTSTESYQKNIGNKVTTHQNTPGATKISHTREIINKSKIDFLRHVLDTERTMAERFEESELRKMLCDTQDMDETSSTSQQRTSRSADGSLMTRALRFSPQLNNFMYRCRFGNEVCFNEFEKTVTEEGLCFTFNGFNLGDLFNNDLVLPMQEDTIQSDDGENNKPFRYMTAGFSLPLVTSLTSTLTRSSRLSDPRLTSNPRRAASHLQFLTLDLFTINEFAEDSCRADAGFKIFIHDPETPAHTATAAAVHEVAMDNEMTVTIAPTLFSTDASAAGTDAYRCHAWRNYHSATNAHNNSMEPLERQELQRFKFYSKANCQYDVIAQFMEQCARCVPFYLPRKPDSVICNSTSRFLLEQCKEELSSSGITKHCIPGCEHVSYSISTSQKYYRWTVEHKLRKYTAMSRVIIRFNDQYAVLKRWTEESLMAETCALVLFVLVIVSVFFGISVISLAELLHSLLAIVCRKDKPQPNIVSKNENILIEDPIAELDIEKITEESPTLSDDLRTFRGRDGY
ncbi:hypothetical protein LSTR_LSTR002348 [Laodelphax striatellus]|uniref:Uncharacterized protein n=1 Tax=Laodelphax striatellus TaxID=195883 RepID=A0A482X256_LAOST|nr:hypothetical protein LSTR_LSTR002348 [Laodelphax striatellus]